MLSLGQRPRELSWWHAGPMLFGDWGTSRLYVLGIAFAATGHGSLFYVALMGGLLLIVGWAYTVICRAYPMGGGVYAAAREQRPVLGMIGGLLLFADYVVTASLSALAAYQYLGVERPELWAMGSILLLGVVHDFGPKKAGVLALWIAGAAFACYLVVAAWAAPSLPRANLEIPRDSVAGHWKNLVHIVLALSGVEAVANMTGIMVAPVARTARWTVWPVALEVVGLNLVFALAMNALPEPLLASRSEDMLRALAEAYVGPGFAAVASAVFALLLLSASSTAITGMLGIQFAMSRDGELPRMVSRLNRFGVPRAALGVATLAPVAILAVQSHQEGLAALYAIGVVGAIAINCLSSARTRTAGIRRSERRGLLAVGAFMACVWVTIAIEKPQALLFAGVVVGAGLLTRVAFRRYRAAARPVQKIPFPADAPRILIASRGDANVVNEGIDHAAQMGAAVVVCLVRETAFVLPGGGGGDLDPRADPEADALFAHARRRAQDRNVPVRTFYELSRTPMYEIADHAVTLGVVEIHVGGSRRSAVERLLRGNPLKDLRKVLPPEIRIVVHRPRQPGGVVAPA